MNELLREFVRTRSPDAFDRLIAGHVDAIYSQCMRQLRDAALAEEVTQSVLVTLVQKAGKIPERSVLEGWLFVTTRYCCANALRAATRRRSAEERAARMRHEAIGESQSDNDLSSQAEPMLDDAIAGLGQCDRNAVLLRFFQGQSLREVGQAMGISEDAAKQRVGRAVEKLRNYFARHGLNVPSATVVAWLGAAVKPVAPHVAQAAIAAAIARSAASKALYAWPWTKVAASLLVVGALTTAAVVTTHGSTANSQTALTPTPAMTIPLALDAVPPPATQALDSQTPSDQQTPFDTLGKLCASIEAGDRSAISECLCDDGTSPADAALARIGFDLEASVFHLDQAWRSKFGGPVAVRGVGFAMVPSGLTIDSFLHELLKLSPAPQTTIDGDFAQMRVPLPPDMFAGTGENRIAAFGRWSGAMIVFKHVDNRWKLDTDRTFNFYVEISRQPGNKRDSILIEQQICSEMSRGLDGIAQSIQQGSISTKEQASDAVLSTCRRSDLNANANGDNWFVLPVIGGTPGGN